MSLSLSGRLDLSVNSARYDQDQILSPKERAKHMMIQLQIKTRSWFDSIEDLTVIGDYHRIESKIIDWRKFSLVKEDTIKFIGEINFDKLLESVSYSVVEKLKSIMQDRELLKNTLIEEAKINSNLFDEYLANRDVNNLMMFYEKNIKLCPISNALDLLEIQQLKF